MLSPTPSRGSTPRKRSRNPAGAELAALALVACGGPHYQAIPEPPERETRATLAGPLCNGEACTCAEDGAGAGQPDGQAKRFEIRLGPAQHELWATVDQMVLYKTGERATDCFYVDLLPGEHAITVRAKHPDFVGFEAHVAEQGGDAERPLWYHTLDFRCGGQCTAEQLTDFKRYAIGKQGKLDPCGSTRVDHVTWQSGRMPDQLHPDDVRLELGLDVYKFAPTKPPCPVE